MKNLKSHLLHFSIAWGAIGVCMLFCFISCNQQNKEIFIGEVKNQIEVEYYRDSILIKSLDKNGKEEEFVSRTKLTRRGNTYLDEEHHIILSLKDTTYTYRSSPLDEVTVFIKKEKRNMFSSMRMETVKMSLKKYELIEAIYYTSDFHIKSFVANQYVTYNNK
ncbi:hypothetical protein [Prevotella histicola]|uniref:hypothetical protein n=1 Tax=Prevotella histicola TaxID=470565 RepID=UPI001C601189|nr:hypothetical protein [Prevotella histicola]MBW4776287.1 hypothetical protein [Prevotella histicola]